MIPESLLMHSLEILFFHLVTQYTINKGKFTDLVVSDLVGVNAFSLN